MASILDKFSLDNLKLGTAGLFDAAVAFYGWTPEKQKAVFGRVLVERQAPQVYAQQVAARPTPATVGTSNPGHPLLKGAREGMGATQLEVLALAAAERAVAAHGGSMGLAQEAAHGVARDLWQAMREKFEVIPFWVKAVAVGLTSAALVAGGAWLVSSIKR